MNLQDHEREALTILQEECLEVAHAISKALRHGLDSDNRGKLSTDNRENIVFELTDNRENIVFELEQALFSSEMCIKLGLIRPPEQIAVPDLDRVRNFHHLEFEQTGPNIGDWTVRRKPRVV